MKLTLITTVALALVAAANAANLAQQGAQSTRGWTIPNDDEIRHLLAERMARNGVGMVVGVIEPAGRRVVVRGKSGAPDNRPLDGDTVFQIGSITKVFTGLVLAEMVQRGEVGIDDPASKYLPAGVKMPQRGRPITLMDLSKHWSGLPSMPTNFALDADPDPYSAYSVEQLYEFLSTYELPREPGTQEYSNLGVALLGRLLARRAGMEYETLLQQRVLRPLGLKSTSIRISEDQRRRLAPGHDRFLNPVDTWELLAMPASGSLRSTANDLLNFLAFNLGQQDSPLHPAMLYQRTPGRALGWGRSTLGGDSVYGHEGGKEGYRSAVVFNPRTKTGVVVLMNSRTDDRPMALARHFLFGGSPLSPAAPAPSRPASVQLDSKTIAGYVGHYRLPPDGLLRVMRKGDRLFVDSTGDGVTTFLPSSSREFLSNVEDARIVFENDANGRVVGLTMRVSGKAIKGTKIVNP